MLYTVVSEYDIFCQNAKSRTYMDIAGGKVEYIQSGRNRKIVGLFSTNPAMYLDNSLLPGRVIELNSDKSAAKKSAQSR